MGDIFHVSGTTRDGDRRYTISDIMFKGGGGAVNTLANADIFHVSGVTWGTFFMSLGTTSDGDRRYTISDVWGRGGGEQFL